MSQLSRVLRDAAISGLCFALLLAALVSIDPRVRARVGQLADNGPDGWTAHAQIAIEGVAVTLADLSLSHAPHVLFAAVGALLVLAMLRS